MSPAKVSVPRFSLPCFRERLSGMTIGADPARVFNHHINRFLCEHTRTSAGRYATMFFGILSPNGRLEISQWRPPLSNADSAAVR